MRLEEEATGPPSCTWSEKTEDVPIEEDQTWKPTRRQQHPYKQKNEKSAPSKKATTKVQAGTLSSRCCSYPTRPKHFAPTWTRLWPRSRATAGAAPAANFVQLMRSNTIHRAHAHKRSARERTPIEMFCAYNSAPDATS